MFAGQVTDSTQDFKCLEVYPPCLMEHDKVDNEDARHDYNRGVDENIDQESVLFRLAFPRLISRRPAAVYERPARAWPTGPATRP